MEATVRTPAGQVSDVIPHVETSKWSFSCDQSDLGILAGHSLPRTLELELDNGDQYRCTLATITGLKAEYKVPNTLMSVILWND